MKVVQVYAPIDDSNPMRSASEWVECGTRGSVGCDG